MNELRRFKTITASRIDLRWMRKRVEYLTEMQHAAQRRLDSVQNELQALLGEQQAGDEPSVETPSASDVVQLVKEPIPEEQHNDGDTIVLLNEEREIRENGEIYEEEATWGPLSGRYTEIRVIGEGGFGKVVEVERMSDGERCAAKSSKMKKPIQPGPDEVREIWTMRRTNHCNLIRCHDVHIEEFEEGSKDASGFVKLTLVMSLVAPPWDWAHRHSSLQRYLLQTSNIKLSEPIAALVIQQVATGLAYLHDVMRIVHRDLKADNVLVGAGGFHDIKVCDYGTCIHLELHPTLEHPFAILKRELPANVGTCTYRAPELWDAILNRGGWKATAVTTTKADIWSLGCLLYFVIAQVPCYMETMIEKPFFFAITEGWVNYDLPEWEDASQGCRDLVEGMLTLKVEERLDVNQVLQHPWLVQQMEALHHCDKLHDTPTRLFDVPLAVAVARSDHTGDLIPWPVMAAVEWLSLCQPNMKEKEKTKTPNRLRVMRHVECFNVDNKYRIPQDEDPSVVIALVCNFLSRLTAEEGAEAEKVTLLCGTVHKDKAKSIQLGEKPAEERPKLVRKMLEKLSKKRPHSVATLEVLCRVGYAQTKLQAMDGSGRTPAQIVTQIAMRYAPDIHQIVEEVIIDPKLCAGLTPKSCREIALMRAAAGGSMQAAAEKDAAARQKGATKWSSLRSSNSFSEAPRAPPGSPEKSPLKKKVDKRKGSHLVTEWKAASSHMISAMGVVKKLQPEEPQPPADSVFL